MSLAILFVFCLFYKVIVHYPSRYVPEPQIKLMMIRRLETIHQIYRPVRSMIVVVSTLDMGRVTRENCLLDCNRLGRQMGQRRSTVGYRLSPSNSTSRKCFQENVSCYQENVFLVWEWAFWASWDKPVTECLPNLGANWAWKRRACKIKNIAHHPVLQESSP